MPKCQIKWIDQGGQPTPDTNTAIGRVCRCAHVEQHGARAIRYLQSDWFYICHHHAQRLADPGMHHWVFEALEIKD